MIVEVGRKETNSDCFVHFEPKNEGGVEVELKSKVESMYGESIIKTVNKMMNFFSITNAYIYIEDEGAFPFVLTARIESAIKKCFPDKNKEFVSDIVFKYKIERDSFRRTRLYVPGDQPRLIINAGLYKPDMVILDLEDSVAPSEKFSARFIVRNALREVDFFGCERSVRINQLPMGLEDLPFVVGNGVHTILIPKCESADDVQEVDKKIKNIILNKEKNSTDIYLIPIIESALGVVNAYKIATASKNVVALAIGLEDFTADIGAERTKEGKESLLARQEVIIAARAAKVQPLDTVFSDVDDEEGLLNSVIEAKKLGFEGKGCIHPRQIKIIHNGFAPTDEEIEKAKKIVAAYNEAQKKGLGVVALGSKMIDPPVVKRAQRIIKLAKMSGKLNNEW